MLQNTHCRDSVVALVAKVYAREIRKRRQYFSACVSQRFLAGLRQPAVVR